MTESEVKFYLPKERVATINDELKVKGFEFIGELKLIDYFFNVRASEIKGFDFLRLRRVNDKTYLRTEKKWELSGNTPVRSEEEEGLSLEQGDRFVNENPSETIIEKRRLDFKGVIDDMEVTISVDILKVNGSDQFFIEAETLTTPENSEDARRMMAGWLKSELKIDTSQEAPSMLELIGFLVKN